MRRRETFAEWLAPWVLVLLFVVAPIGAVLEFVAFQYLTYIVIFAFLGLLLAGAVFILIANISIWWNNQ